MSNPSSADELREALAELREFGAGRTLTLPPACYTSEAFLELEREEIFRKEWVCLGRVEEVPKPGDYFTTKLIEKPKKVRPWFWESGGVWFFQIRYGAKGLELAKDKPTIEAGDKENLLEIIDLCSNAVKDGELDNQLNEMAMKTRSKLRKSKAA